MPSWPWTATCASVRDQTQAHAIDTRFGGCDAAKASTSYGNVTARTPQQVYPGPMSGDSPLPCTARLTVSMPLTCTATMSALEHACMAQDTLKCEHISQGKQNMSCAQSG